MAQLRRLLLRRDYACQTLLRKKALKRKRELPMDKKTFGFREHAVERELRRDPMLGSGS
jgi:hypothetical protein